MSAPVPYVSCVVGVVPINKLEHALQYTEEASSAFDGKLRLRRVSRRVYNLAQLLDEFVQNEHIHDSKHNEEGG